MRILLIEDQPDVADKIRFLLESSFGGRVEGPYTVAEANDFFKGPESGVDLIIYDYQKLDYVNGTAPELLQLFKRTQKTPCIVCYAGTLPSAVAGRTANKKKIVGYADRGSLISELERIISEQVGKGLLRNDNEDTGFIRIRTHLLLAVAPLKGDIYIRLSENKYVKLFRQGDVFDRADLEKYTVQKKVEYLYIRKKDCQEFAQKYAKDLEALLKFDLSPAASVKHAAVVYETVQALSSRIGFTPEVQNLVKTQIQVTMKSMSRSPGLTDVLNLIKSTPEKYITAHSTLLAQLACAIAAKMEWGSDATFHRLNLAAFLHDMTLENNELAAFNSIAELEKALEIDPNRFTAAEIKAFKNHPVKGAEAAKGFTEVPPDVDQVILQHHERPDGSGFPRGLSNAYISPLSAIFIVAHDLTQYALQAGPGFNIGTFLATARFTFKSNQFKKVIAVLEQL